MTADSPRENPIAWSHSRARRLEDCPRAYFYNYYAAFNGKHPGATDEEKQALRLKRMANLTLLAGIIVHDLVEEILVGLRHDRHPRLKDLKEKARRQLNRAWRESKRKRWLEDPRRFTNLFEHYYERPVPPDRIEAIRGRVFTCLENFLQSRIFAFLKESDPDDWLAVEEFATFDVEGTEAIVKPDLAVRHGDQVFLFDWKTGKPHDSHLRQLAAYGIHAVRAWDVEVDRLLLVPAYLLTGEIRKERITASDLDDAEARIRQDIERMRDHLVDPEEDTARKEDFPMTTQHWRCQRCVFLELCEEELRKLDASIPF